MNPPEGAHEPSTAHVPGWNPAFDASGLTAELLSTSDATSPDYGGVSGRVRLACPPDRAELTLVSR
jgi:hypothetical protein